MLVADNADQAGDFETDAEHVAQTLLNGRADEMIYISQQGAGARISIRAAFDRGDIARRSSRSPSSRWC